MSDLPIYLDYNATTPCDPQVVEAMLPYFYEQPGNAGSRNHPYGWLAEEAVKEARTQVALLIKADPREIIFTSGATESDNLALKGAMEGYRLKGRHLITVATEHRAVLDTCAKLARQGCEVTYLTVNKDGLVDLEELDSAIRPDTVLVAVMWGNNETGVIQPMAEIGRICHHHGVLLMSDATQVVGKMPIDPRGVGVHLMAFTAHKMYGPKGIGGLYVSRQQPKVRITAQLDGGRQEQGVRSGTLNIPGIVGFGKAAELASRQIEEEAQRLGALRDRLEQGILEQVNKATVNGTKKYRLPHVSNLYFPHADAEQLMLSFSQRLAVSSGSACTSAMMEPSHVLTAMGLTTEEAYCSLRFSLGRFTTAEQVEDAIAIVARGVAQIVHS